MAISESEVTIIINSFSSGSVIVNATVELSSDTNATAAEKAVEDGLKAVTQNSTAFGYQVEADSISTQGMTVDPTETTTQAADTNTGANGADGGTTTQATESNADGGTTTQASANAGGGSQASSNTGDETTTQRTSGSGGGSQASSNTEGETTTQGTSGSDSNTATTTSSDSSGSGSNTADTTSSGTSSSGSNTADTTSSGTSSSGTNTAGTSDTSSSGGTSGSSGGTTANTDTNTNTNTGTNTNTATSTNTNTNTTGTTGTTTSTLDNVEVDKTSVSGSGLFMSVNLKGLTSTQVTDYLTKTSSSYTGLQDAATTYTNLVKASSQTTKVTSALKLKRVIKINATTVRAEYLATANSNVDLAALRNSMLQNQDMQNLDFTLKTVALTVANRWVSVKLKVTNRQFETAMSDPTSSAFKNFKNTFQPLLLTTLREKVKAVVNVVVMELLSGSVVVRASVESDSTATTTTKNDISTALTSVNSLGSLTLDTTKEVTAESYLTGGQLINPVTTTNTDGSDILRDTEDISQGDVSLAESEADKIKIKTNNYFFTVTIPSFCAVLLLIIILLCCTTSNSCLCRICSSDPKNVP
ncbi:serine-rich adhesin for platelets-like isoform X3 [Penaeus monodon]|uniref:serine-rich adhesin for platelets-like isoform X3 n=1 Tax=Penaeus monodon TaxID=6687 RepID=UPI0018A774C3|nr:serine-rich adhesin for platelets-like isoform X3 [Penaeus monodon]